MPQYLERLYNYCINIHIPWVNDGAGVHRPPPNRRGRRLRACWSWRRYDRRLRITKETPGTSMRSPFDLTIKWSMDGRTACSERVDPGDSIGTEPQGELQAKARGRRPGWGGARRHCATRTGSGRPARCPPTATKPNRGALRRETVRLGAPHLYPPRGGKGCPVTRPVQLSASLL